MLIPIRSDCDLYHWPFATVGLIAANLLAAIPLELGNGPLTDSWMLVYGDGLHPVQWLTANFVHFGACHLIGNMIFLWAFGLGIEGRIGWWRFLLLYLGIGIAGCALHQIWMADGSWVEIDGVRMPGPRGAGGASIAIFGIMAVALLWHPFREIECIWIVCLAGRPVAANTVEIGVFWFAGLKIVLEIFLSGHYGFPPSSETAHAIGAVIGAMAGLVMLKNGLVDCEGEDIFNVGKTSTYFDQFKGPRNRRSPAEQSKRSDQIRSLCRNVADQHWQAASEMLLNLPENVIEKVDLATLRTLGDRTYRLKNFTCAEIAYAQIMDRSDNVPAVVCLKLAAIQLEIHRRPKAAVRALESLNGKTLSESQLAKRAAIQNRAEHLIDSGCLEIAT